jgi:hypothetical protein
MNEGVFARSMRVKKNPNGDDYDSLATADQQSVQEVTAAVDMYTKRPDALSRQAMVGLAVFLLFTIFVYVTWVAYVKA